MPIKICRVPELSFEPFYNDMERQGVQVQDMAQALVAAAVEKGEIDGGPVPLADCFRLEDRFRYVAGFCVAAWERAGSSFLYCKEPVGELTGARIAVPGQTSTSERLLQVLLAFKYQVQPEAFVSLEDPHDAFLLVGDQALRRRRGVRGYPHKYDLGEEWYQWTGLPFVFARWMARRDMDPAEAALLENTLYVGLEEGVDALFHLSEPRDNLLMRAKDILEYIQGHRYFMGRSEHQSVSLFRQYLGQLESLTPRSGRG